MISEARYPCYSGGRIGPDSDLWKVEETRGQRCQSWCRLDIERAEAGLDHRCQGCGAYDYFCQLRGGFPARNEGNLRVGQVSRIAPGFQQAVSLGTRETLLLSR